MQAVALDAARASVRSECTMPRPASSVDRAGPDRDGGAETVAVHDLAVEQVGDGGEP
jgi:hypothetical protein